MSNICGFLKGEGTVEQKNLKIFSLALLSLQAILLVCYGLFIRMYPNVLPDALEQQRLTLMQHSYVMIVLGVGFAMTFIKNHSLSALTYTFLINAIVFQLYMLLTNFWSKVIFQAFTNDPVQKFVGIQTIDLSNAIGCILVILISFASVIGRVGPKDLLLMAVFESIFYTLNETIVKYKIWTYDVGGSVTVHAFGTYFGLAVSWILNKKVASYRKAKTARTEMVFSMLGTLILWIYWPSLLCNGATNYYEEEVISTNTIYALSGSCVGTFVLTSMLGNKISMEDILNATLSGGVAIGSAANINYLPPVALAIGFVVGIISTLCFRFLTPLLERKVNLYDTCGTNNLHGIPGILGGIFSAIIIACYSQGYDKLYVGGFGKGNLWELPHASSFQQQGLYQIAGTFCSVGVAIVSGLICGLLMSVFYDEEDSNFFRDDKYFQIEEYYSSSYYNNNDETDKLLTGD